MACYDEGRLMAYLDGQLSPREGRALKIHLETCPGCREVLDSLAGEQEWVTQLLARYHQAVQTLPVSKPRSWSVPADRDNVKKGAVSWMRRYYQWAAVAVVVGLLFSFAPARSLAAQFLSVFRVEKVQVLHFDPADLHRLAEALYNQDQVSVRNFGEVESEPLTDPAFIRQEEMPEKVGDYVREPGSGLRQGAVVKITPEVEGINKFLRGQGSTTLLPPELAGKTFKITLPDMSSFNYHNRQTGKNLNVSRVAAPVLEVPAGVPMPVVRQALLDLPILPPDLKSALEGIDDWTRTLPMPAFDGQTEEITLDGAPGFFIQGREYPRHPDGRVVDEGLQENTYYGNSVLAWNRNGIWTVLEGPAEMTKAEAFDLARQFEAALDER